MSGAPKRPYDDGSRHLSSKHTVEDTNVHPNNLPVKPTQSVSNEYHPPPLETGHDGRVAKVPRIDSRDADKRSALPIYRVPLSSGDAGLDYPVSSESRLEVRDTKENRDLKVDSRVTKTETKVLHIDARVDPECSRIEKDVRLENKGNDNKETKHESESQMDFKSKMKMEKNFYTSGSTHQNWKESKEHHRADKYSDTSGQNMSAWTLQGTHEILQGRSGTDKEHSTSETKMDSLSARTEKDVRPPSGGDESKGTKQDKEPHIDSKNEARNEKDGYAGTSPFIRREPKEHQRGNRYPDTSGGTSTAWLSPQNNLQGFSEIGKEPSATKELDRLRADEVAGEDKISAITNDKLNEKDKKRIDEKHKDWEEMDKDKNERRNNLQQGFTNTECRDPVKAERKWEGWGERKDILKKEQPKEKEDDHIQRDTVDGIEKIVSHSEKELVNGSVKMPEQESPSLEQKGHRESDSCKVVDRDSKDKRQERDMDVEGDRLGKRWSYDKESDDGCTEGDGGSERERDVFGHGVQQRKRMLRPRGSPQMGIREPRFHSRSRDNEGSQGKPEVSSVVYKVGGCMQELLKLWKEFETSQENKNTDCSHSGPSLDIHIPTEYVTATNRQVRGGQLWGTDIYTGDSDLVAVLMHTGYCRPTASPPPPAILELRTTIRVLPPQHCYASSLRNNVRSRAWGAATGCSYRVERCCIVKKGGGTIDLEPCLTHTSTVEPTLAPVAVERSITTRSAASNALRQQRFVREVTIQYNHCNEPWIKYSISIVADKGLKKPLYTSARLKKGEVLYLETHTNRYELCFSGEKTVPTASRIPATETEKIHPQNSHASNGERGLADTTVIDCFRWSRCKKPLSQKLMRSLGIPLPLEHVEVLEESLDWEDVQWSQTGVWVAGKEYTLARVHFLSL